MTIDANDPRITAFLFDELDGAERESFLSELESSAELQSVVEQTRETLGELQKEMQTDPLIALSAEQRAGVVDRIEQSAAADVGRVDRDTPAGKPAGQRKLPPRRRTTWAVAAASVAALGLVAVAGILINEQAKSGRLQMVAAGPMGENHDASTDDLRLQPDDLRLQPGEGEIREELSLENEEYLLDPQSPTSESVEATVKVLRAEASAAPVKESEVRIVNTSDSQPSAGQPPQPSFGLTPLASKPTAAPSGLDSSGNTPFFAGGQPAPAKQPLGGSVGGYGGAGFGGGGGGLGGGGLGGGGRGKSQDRFRAGVRFESGDDGLSTSQGSGPGRGGDRHDLIVENDFLKVNDNPLSTFSIDVDTASYSKVRMYLQNHRQLPRRDAVRIEELVNYFPYDYQAPTDERPFAANMEVTECPWNSSHRLLRVALKGKEIQNEKRPASNLVFLLDVSGSMKSPNKLPLLKRGMKMLVDQLGENDQVAIVVYASATGLVLDSTNGDQKATILEALDRLQAGGSTNGGAGINLAYQKALDNFIKGGVNRVILCTDGDFNVGITGDDTLTQLAERQAKTGVFLSVLGFGTGNLNDAMLESISNKGNGNYAFIDSDSEARKVLVEQMSGTLVTIAKDVKIQIEFNPSEVAAYRLIGYENRVLAAKDFNDDKKDAGEIGAGHSVTALYELAPANRKRTVDVPEVDDLKYQRKRKLTKKANDGELLTLKLRYKEPDGDTSKLLEFPLSDEGKRFGDTDKDFRFAASVAAFGMILRDSKYKGNATYDAVLEIASEAASDDGSGYRSEFVRLVNAAKKIAGQ